MSTTAGITLQHIITELERTVSSRKESYQSLVKSGKMSPYTRDHRVAVMERLLQVCRQAKAEKENTVFQQLKNIHQ